MAVNYKLCPKCELNWIPEDQDICDVCKQLTKGGVDIYDEIDDEDLKLCPVCNMNYILESEEMCESCSAENSGEEEQEPAEETYDFTEDVIMPGAEEEDDMISLEGMQDEEEEEEEEEGEEKDKEEDEEFPDEALDEEDEDEDEEEEEEEDEEDDEKDGKDDK
jgi:RNA polymerase subunit RPABC4/transcription elongation factor Spt4